MSEATKPEENLRRKDPAEDIGFLGEFDPWAYLSEVMGEPFREYRRRWAAASDLALETEFPLQLDFELNNLCNLKCEMCTWSVEAMPKSVDFPTEKFKQIIVDGVKRGLRSVDFSYVNEPLIRRDLPELIRFAKEAGIQDLAFNTNAMLLTPEVSDSLLGSGLTRIQFSMDGFKPETFEKVRAGADHARVMRNILGFLEMKKARGLKVPLTAVSFVRMSVNETEWPDFAEFWRGKVDYVILREYLSPYGESSPHHSEKDALFAERRHVVKDFKCNKPWQRLVVRADGTVLPCCTFQAVQLPMGNVLKTPLHELWTQPKMRDLRALHARGEYHKNKTCLECALCSTGDKNLKP